MVPSPQKSLVVLPCFVVCIEPPCIPSVHFFVALILTLLPLTIYPNKQTNEMITVSLFLVNLPFHHPQFDLKGAVYPCLQLGWNHSQQVLVEAHHAKKQSGFWQR